MHKLLALNLALALAGWGAVAKDWPEYCGSACKNLVADATGLPDSFEPGEKDSIKGEIVAGTASNVLWGVRTSSLTYPSPTIAGGRIFTGGKEAGLGIFKCLDAHNGKVLWQYAEPFRKFPERIDGDWKYMLGHITPNLGICATATFSDGRLFVVNHRAEVVCFDAAGGAEPFVAPQPSETKPKKGEKPQPPPATPADVITRAAIFSTVGAILNNTKWEHNPARCFTSSTTRVGSPPTAPAQATS